MNIKFPVSWLKDYLKTDLAAKTLARELSLSGPSVERIAKVKEDFIFDVEVTSNRPDSASVFGLAREAHSILSYKKIGSELKNPKGLNLELEPDVSKFLKLEVIIKNKSLCPRFAAIVIDNVKIKPSPALIKNRLEACGIRAINNIVDISNYIMLELGQPMHTFDYDKIKDSKMVLREANEGEKLTTLDGQTRKLPKGAIVIEDSKRLIDLCGIMGGQNSEISRRTKRVVLFVQAYDSLKIRKTTQALAFRTEAAARFEKGVDIDAIPQALSRAVYLAKKTAGAKIASELIDIYPNRDKPNEVSLELSKLNSYLGIEIKPTEASKILESLGFNVKSEPGKIKALAPSWRKHEIEQDVDLIEEIARIYGYHNLPSRLPQGEPPGITPNEFTSIIKLKNALRLLGLTEVMTYSIVSKDLINLTGENAPIELTNPLTEEWQFMRSTLVPSLASVIAKNKNINSELKIFEVAKTYENTPNGIPKQSSKVAILLNNSDFRKSKGLVENLFEILERKYTIENYEGKNQLFDKSRSAQIKIHGEVIGFFGKLQQKITDHFDIESDVFALEINLTKVYESEKSQKSYKPLPKYPPVIEDISAIFPVETQIGNILSEVKKAGTPLVKEIKIIDIFQDEKIGRDKKSVTLRLSYQRSDKTPLQEEVVEVKNNISNALENAFNAKIRN